MLHVGAVGWGANLGSGEMGRNQTGQIRVTRTERVMSHVPPTGFATRFLAMIQVRILTSIIVFCEASSDRLFIIADNPLAMEP